MDIFNRQQIFVKLSIKPQEVITNIEISQWRCENLQVSLVQRS